MDDPTLIWFLIGAVLLISEFAAPGLVILFFGVGALLTSIAVWLGLADSLQAQLMIFSVGSIVCLFTLRKYMKQWFVGDSKNEPGDFSPEFIDKVVVVIVAIPGGAARGKVELNGAEWSATSTLPQEVGEMVTIIAREGLNLKVM